MEKEYTASGKTVDEAIFNGLKVLGLSFDEVTVEVLKQETHGILGIGAKPALVKLTEREKNSDEIIDVKSMMRAAVPASQPARDTHAAPQRTNETVRPRRSEPVNKPMPEAAAVSNTTSAVNGNAANSSTGAEYVCRAPRREYRSDDRPRSNPPRPNQRTDMPNRPDAQDRPSRPVPPKTIDQAARTARASLEYSKELADSNEPAQFLSNLLNKMGLNATVMAALSEDGLFLRIDTEDTGTIIGHRGETLDALQYLTLLASNKNRDNNDYLRVSVDTQGYREKREEILIRLALSKASSVRASSRPYRFEPMSPYERRVIHSALQSHPYVTTHSEGDEPNRCVIIVPKSQPYRRGGNSRYDNSRRAPAKPRTTEE